MDRSKRDPSLRVPTRANNRREEKACRDTAFPSKLRASGMTGLFDWLQSVNAKFRTIAAATSGAEAPSRAVERRD
jgi:hypothetical protein